MELLPWPFKNTKERINTLSEQDCRSRTGQAVMVCISASEGSWNLIIVNHIQGSATSWWAGSQHARAREGAVGMVLREGSARVKGAGISGALGQQSGPQVSYRDCRSLTITNTGPSDTATCKWCTSGWQPAIPPQTLPPRITFDCRGHRNAYLDTCHILLKNNKQPISSISSGSRTWRPACFQKIRTEHPRAMLAGDLFNCFSLVIKKCHRGGARERPHHVRRGRRHRHAPLPSTFRHHASNT